MAKITKKFHSNKLNAFNFQVYSRKIIYCNLAKPDIKNFKINTAPQSYSKTKKIYDLISNIYIYKFPPILNWPEGIYIDIPVDYIIAIRRIFEHTTEIVLDNIKELCFSLNTEFSSYGDKVIIIPLEYITGNYDKTLFLDTFAHELGHALTETMFKDKKTKIQIEEWHKIIKYYSIKYNDNLFFDPKISELSLAKYQLEDYKEFFSELYSQMLNHYNDLINYVCKIKHDEAQFAYLNTIDLLMNYVEPFSETEHRELVVNL